MVRSTMPFLVSSGAMAATKAGALLSTASYPMSHAATTRGRYGAAAGWGSFASTWRIHSTARPASSLIFARSVKTNHSTNWVLEPVGDVLWTREIIAKKRISFAQQGDILDDVFKRYRVARCCMDQTGMGEKPVEDAQRKHGQYRVEGVIFSMASKLVLATCGKEAFEDRKIRIPMGDAALRADLHKLQKVSGPTGAPRFVAESDSAGHADRTWACFLACSAASTPAGKIEFQSTRSRRSFTRTERFLRHG